MSQMDREGGEDETRGCLKEALRRSTPRRVRIVNCLDQATLWFGVQKARTGVDGNADNAATYSTGDIVIAILDSGIDDGHVDLFIKTTPSPTAATSGPWAPPAGPTEWSGSSPLTGVNWTTFTEADALISVASDLSAGSTRDVHLRLTTPTRGHFPILGGPAAGPRRRLSPLSPIATLSAAHRAEALSEWTP